MNNPSLKITHLLALSVCALLTGCSHIVKSSVDTQPIVEMNESDYANPDAIIEGKAFFYTPSSTHDSAELDEDLIRYSPVLVQGFQPAGPEDKRNKYDYWQDGIGSPYLINEGEDVRINTDKPSMFCRVEQAQVYGQKLKQLVYVWWYPSRPVGTIEKGQIDGNILRITLDHLRNPIVFEYSQTCGCYHGVFASENLEQVAKEEFSLPLNGKRFALENTQQEKSDWVIRDLIKVNPNQRLFVYVSAGKHFGKAMRYMDIDSLPPQRIKSYALAEYESLVHIPMDEGGSASMFNDKGLVKGAKRSGEEIMMADLDHPGWPRHLDRMLIHWDQDRWSDPKLLEEALRIPHQAAMNPQIAQKIDTALDGKEPVEQPSPSKTENAAANTDSTSDLPPVIYNSYPHNKPFLVMVSHRYCLGCEAFKKKVLPLSDVQEELHHWNFITLDMFVKEQMLIAKPMNITLTPTIICYDQQGHELRRIEGVDSKEKLMKFITG